jgi:GT2 family glycosyltransferase
MKRRKNDIIVIVLNWNDLEMTERCLESLVRQKQASIDILLIDNNSARFPAQKIESKFPSIVISKLAANRGVAGGRNEGILYALKNNYKYLLFIDNDAYAHPMMVYELEKIIKCRPDVGIVGPKIYRDDEKRVVWRAGCLSWRKMYLYSFYSIIRKLYKYRGKSLPTRFEISRGDGYLDIGQYDQEIDIDFQIGCVQMVRVEAIEKIGVLDERFSPYGSEDIDFCERMKNSGWTIRYAPKAITWHSVAAMQICDPERTFNNLKNIILLARKHLDKKAMFCYFFPDFFAIHLPLLFIDNIIKNSACAMSILKALSWHAEHIKTEGLFLR